MRKELEDTVFALSALLEIQQKTPEINKAIKSLRHKMRMGAHQMSRDQRLKMRAGDYKVLPREMGL